MKPSEFWNSTYGEVYLFSQTQLIKMADEFKMEIELQEAVTNKLIQASFLYKNPKVVSLKEMFKNLFKQEQKELKVQSPEQQAKILRSIIRVEKKTKSI